MKGTIPFSLLLACAFAATRPSLAFVPLPQVRDPNPNLILKSNLLTRINKLPAEKNDDAEASSLLSSLQLPSPEAVKENIMEGNIGERGEKYVVAQFSLLFCIAVGTLPFIGELSFFGPFFIIVGLILVYKSASDLKNNLSPWPVASDPTLGRGSLITDGIYSYIRHPMYAGLLLGMTGLSILTDSTTRLILTLALYLVLEEKSDFEETSLMNRYGSEYSEYKEDVKSKFFPLDMNKIFTKN